MKIIKITILTMLINPSFFFENVLYSQTTSLVKYKTNKQKNKPIHRVKLVRKRHNMQGNEKSLFFAGVISKLEMSCFQYGKHILKGKFLGGDPYEIVKNYALISDKYDLDKFIGMKVVIKASKIEGYPLENGPIYLNVDLIEDDKPVSVDLVK